MCSQSFLIVSHLIFISIMLIDRRGSIAFFWCFLLGALQFVIRMVGRVYLDWKYSFVHRRSPAPRREFFYLKNQCQCQLQTWGRRHTGCSRLHLSGRADLIRIKLPICLRMRMRYPRGERAATAQQLTGRATARRTCSDSTANARRLQGKGAAIGLQQAQYIHLHVCMYPGQTYLHIHAHVHCL